MQKVNPLEIIDTELAKAQAKTEGKSNKRSVFLYLKPGHTALIRPLYELDKCLALQKHDVYSDELQVAAICAAEQDPTADCFYCFKSANENNMRLSANYRIYLPIFIYNVTDEAKMIVSDETGNPLQGVKILELGAFGKIGDVLRFFRTYMKTGKITQADFAYYHYHDEKSGYKTFKLKEQRAKEMSPKIKAIIPTLDVIKNHIIEAYTPQILDDTKANEYLNDAEIEQPEEDELLPTNFTGL